MNPPPLNSTVLYRNALYQVRNGTRNKATGAITIHLCHCTDTDCQHTKQPAPLDQITQLPQVSDRICHYQTRQPYTLKGYELHNGKLIFKLKSESEEAYLPQFMIDLYPELGDEVLVAAAPYSDWITNQAKAARGNDKSPSLKYRQLMSKLEDFAWMSTVFTLRMINDKNLAVILGDGLRHEVPLEALRVYQKGQRVQKEVVAA